MKAMQKVCLLLAIASAAFTIIGVVEIINKINGPTTTDTLSIAAHIIMGLFFGIMSKVLWKNRRKF